MARKDVDLVIRAKDEAEKVVKSITAAINDFSEAQKNLTAKADKTENSMSALGAAFGQFQKDLRGSNASDVLASSLDKANTAVERLEKSVAGTREEVKRLDSDFKSSSAGVDTLRTAVAASAKALADGQNSLKKYKTDLATTKKEATALAQAEAKLNVSGIEKRLEAKAAAAAKTEARIAELRKQIEGMDNPTKRLSTSLETNTAKLAKQQGEVTGLAGALDKARTKQADLAQKMADTAAKIETSTAAIKAQEGVVSGLGSDYQKVATETKEAEKANSALATAMDKSNSALERQESQLDAAKVELKQFAATSGQAEAALKELSAAGSKGLRLEIGTQARAANEAKARFSELSAETKELAAEMGRVGVPTREMVQDFARLKIESKGAKAEFVTQRDTLGLLRQVYREAGTDVNALANAQSRFVALQGQAGAAIQSSRASTEQSVASLNKLHAGYVAAGSAAGSLAGKTQSTANAQARELTVSEQLARAYRNLYGEKRKALSLTQRLRGNVLSLVAAYGGLYGVIDILRRVVTAYGQVEAAQARLNVAFDGDLDVVASEMDFLRRNAERLGVEFGALSTEYSKFAIATKNTAIEGDAARRLFLQIAEAARVNRSSMAEMQGVFTAVTQIVNKGAVQMEELRQQLGDRLPGAIQLMADGLGVTTAELVKMMEQGQVTAEALVPFGEELERRFGPQLAESLQATAAEMGRLQNAAFNALKLFGESGFIDSFTDLMRDLTEVLQSADGEAFIARLSVAFGALLDVVGFVAQNFQLVAAAAGAFIGIKLVPFVLALGNGFKGLVGSLSASAAAMSATQARAATMGVAVGRSTLAVRALSIAFKGLLSSTGIGLALVAISTAIGYWSTQADKASEAMNAHEKIVDQVKNAYDAASGAAVDWKDVIDETTATQVRANLAVISGGLEDVEDRFDNLAGLLRKNIFGQIALGEAQPVRDYLTEVDKLFTAYQEGEISAREFKDEVDALTEANRDATPRIVTFAEEIIEAADAMVEKSDAVREMNLLLVVLTGNEEEAAAAARELRGDTEDAGEALENATTRGLARFNDAMATLREELPGATSEMAKLEAEADNIETALQAALTAARALPDAILRIAAEQEALAAANAGLMDIASRQLEAGVSGTLVDRIIGVESGGNPNAQNPESTATGLGQFIESTWLRMFKQYFPDRAAGMTNAAILALRTDADASRAMVQLYIEENARSLQAAGIAINDANLYLAHFLGPGGARDLIGSAPGTVANDVLGSGQISANASILDGKTREEVIAWAQRKVGISERELAVAETIQQSERERAEEARKEAERRAEAAQEFHDQTAAGIAQEQFELSIADQQVVAREQALAIREAELAAAEAGTTLSAEERANILATVEAKYRQQQIDEATADSAERRAEAEERINALMEHRDSLKTQLDAAVEGGETEAAEELRLKIEEINGQLETAITNAQNMWSAVGGEQGDAAVARLEALRIKAAEFGQEADQAYFSWAKVGELLVNGLTSAFDTFAQAVANGTSIGEAARDAFLSFASDFLRQIAQMIIKQAIFNALKGTGLGGFLGIGVAHSGGRIGSQRAGSGNAGRRVNPAVFNGAARFHVGGMPGLRPGEVPIIAKENEEVLTRDDPRHVLNGGKSSGKDSGGGTMNAKIVNAIDAPSFLEAALNSPAGEKVFLNFMRANQNAVSGTGF